MLADYQLGGRQTDYLRRLVEEVRKRGLRPVLYSMPLSETHRRFFPPGQYEAFAAHVSSLARQWAVGFHDFDAHHTLGDGDFVDSHHLGPAVADRFTRRFADVVLVPMLTGARSLNSPSE